MNDKYARWSLNKTLTHRPCSSALSYPDKFKSVRNKAYSSSKRKRQKRKMRKLRIDCAILQYLKLDLGTHVCETHIRDVECKLGLPVIRLRLDREVPFSTLKGRKARIYGALKHKHPQLC